MKLIIADDHELVRDALASLVERDSATSKVFQASNFQEALALLLSEGEIDLVLLDVFMPGMNDMQSITEMVQRFPDIPVVLMSGNVTQHIVDRGFEMGARGFIPKTMNGRALISVLNLVCSGTKYVPEIMLTKQDAETHSIELSPREQQVLQQLAKGLSNKVIARELSIEQSTVKLHLRSLFKKLGASNRTEAVIKARDANLCS